MAFIVDPGSSSFGQIKAELKAFVDAAPDALKWKDFFASGAGQTIIDLVAALGTFISYDVIVARREGFLRHVQNRSSAVGAAEYLGYSAFRGRNTIIEITVTPNTTALIPKFAPIGTIKDQDLLMLEDTALNTGVPVTFKAIIGNLDSEEVTVTTISPASFRFTKTGASQDIRVYLNNVEVDISERIVDLVNEKFVVQSNVLGAVDVMYLNSDTFTTRYNIGDVIKAEWIVLSQIDFAETDIIFDYGTVTGFVIDTLYKAPESTEEIKVNAPLFNETQFVIRGRDDYMKVFKLLNTDINDTSYTDITAAIVDLCYVQKESCLFSNSQLAGFISQLAGVRPMGLKPPTISHPRMVFLDLEIMMTLLNSSGNPTLEAENIISKLEHILEQQISFADLENSLESLNFVKIARVNRASTTWAADTFYRMGKHVKANPDNGKLYKMNDVAYKSGASEPTWPNSLPLGQSVEDGSLVWCSVDLNSYCPPISPTTWTANTRYKLDDVVLPVVPFTIPNPPGSPINVAFKVCDYINKSKADTAAVAASASYTGALKAQASYDGTNYIACNAGTAGNSIALAFNGTDTVQQVTDAWNTPNPGNCVNFDPPANTANVSPAGALNLTGGQNTSNFLFSAVTPGGDGNNITLAFNGTKTVGQVISDWNISHPTNQVSLLLGDLNAIFPVTTFALSGGADTISGEPAWPGSLLPPC